MRLSDEFDDVESKNKLPLVYMTIGMITFLVFVIVLVVGMNHDQTNRIKTQSDVNVVEEVTDNTSGSDLLAELGIGESTLTSDQLDFWNMYKDDNTQLGQQISANTLTKDEKYEKNAQKLLEEEEAQEAQEDLSEGGTKTMVKRPDGTEQWIMINAYIPKNNYQEVGFIYDDPVMKYYHDGAKQSFLGAMITSDDGDVDFSALRKAGVEFVMLRVGYRGYESGEINMDANYYNNFQKAKDADLNVGIFFESQAVNEEEALAEAEFVLTNVVEMHVTYPVVFKMGLVPHVTTRSENLTKSELSQLANVFCERIKESGLKPMVYGDKYWLLRKLDLTLMNAYDIWLSQEGEKPDYPYEFTMWEYKNAADIEGVSNDIPLSISFVDYAKR